MAANTLRRVILLAYHYPPSPAVGAIRAAKVAKALAAAGHDVHVLTIPSAGGAAETISDGPNLTRHLVPPERSPREWVNHLRRVLSGRGSVSRSGSAQGTAPAAEASPAAVHTSALKRYFFSILWLPDDVQGFIRPAARLARQLAAAQPSLIYSSAPPFSPHLAARRAKRDAQVPLVLEFRDPWVDNPQKPAHVRSQLADWLDARLERNCLRAADLIVSVSNGIDRLLSQKLPPTMRDKCVMIRNGIDGLATPAPLPARPFRIMHAGTCSYGRDPRPFLRALAAAVKTLALGPGDVEVRFVGMCRAYGGDDLATLAANLGLGGMLHLEDWIPRDAALHLMSESHLLLVLAQEQPDQVPNKVYEYLGSGRPVLAYADEGGEVASLLQPLPGHHVATRPEDPATQAFLEASLREGRSQVPVDDPRLMALTADQQMSRLVGRVQSLGVTGRG